MKVSNYCKETIARYTELDEQKLGAAEIFVTKWLNGATVDAGKFDALVSYTYRKMKASEDAMVAATSLIKAVAKNPNARLSGVFVKGAGKDTVKWAKEEVNMFENL